ncbi:translation elongation factor EF-1 alpha [Ordospora colligata OC4]|uniref:Translation elongation factor EF-1 alpha n=1 Tax=Ordospora colligata OC4 TaxID=1354746 RepID=A0A0B2UL08_9MICR|nr:translation elongation factor EF-1 alpha [Ordospora colligata OC4]KHN69959.1 translation elongation factor EF-1 alpha [Ordospora colligata OC4]TBU16129.1 translation elongation factor EF-1 alpha [Ordospora colligata]TBU16342.1 translation elongation factor EF-1 alpha [Ordospora colligata]
MNMEMNESVLNEIYELQNKRWRSIKKKFKPPLTMAENNEKKQLNVCVIGHVDSGKSTTVGQFLYKLGTVNDRDLEKNKKLAQEYGKDSFEYAFVTDKTAEERRRGITITTTLVKASTEKYELNILDCPGHIDFIKNMVTGAAQADVGVVVVPADGFEACLGKNGTLQSHIMIAGVLGCKKLVVCINKMDSPAIPVNERAKKFNDVRTEMVKTVIRKCHPDKDPIVIPISAKMGVNLIENGEKYDWFEGWSDSKNPDAPKIHTLEAALNYQTTPERPSDKPLRIVISGIHKISGIGNVYTGRVDSGKILTNMKVVIQPAGVYTEVKSLEIHRQAKKEVECGENCGIAFKNASKGDFDHVKTGHVISKDDETAAKLYPAAEANIVVTDRPTGFTAGYSPFICFGVLGVSTVVAFLKKKMNKQRIAEENPERMETGESGTVVIIPQKAAVFDSVTEFPSLGRFAAMDSKQVVFIGSIVRPLTAEMLQSEYGITADSVGAKDATAAAAGKKKK